MTHNPRTAGDERRALALIQHHHACDYDGLNTVLREAVDTGRVGQLVVTLLDVYEQLLPLLFAKPGRDAINEQLSDLASGAVPAPATVAIDLTADDLRRAARLVLAHAGRDGSAVDEILFEQPSITPLIVGVMSLMSVLVPVLNSRTAIDLLREAALRAAGLEAEDE